MGEEFGLLSSFVESAAGEQRSCRRESNVLDQILINIDCLVAVSSDFAACLDSDD